MARSFYQKWDERTIVDGRITRCRTRSVNMARNFGDQKATLILAVSSAKICAASVKRWRPLVIHFSC